jgi:predicted double-glycine peptidase
VRTAHSPFESASRLRGAHRDTQGAGAAPLHLHGHVLHTPLPPPVVIVSDAAAGPVARAPLPDRLVHVPSVKQQTNFSCGNAATLALLRYWQWDAFADVDEAALYQPLETTRAEGTEPEPIVAYLHEAGHLEAVYRHGDVTVEELERAVDARQPPIVDLQAWQDGDLPWRDVWDAGHYVVMVGYDADRLFFMDPSRMTPMGYTFLPRPEFEERWHDLSGHRNDRVERMAIFARGFSSPWTPVAPAGDSASKLG